MGSPVAMATPVVTLVVTPATIIPGWLVAHATNPTEAYMLALFEAAIAHGLADEESVRRMVGNYRARRFDAAHYTQMWVGRIADAERGINAAADAARSKAAAAAQMQVAAVPQMQVAAVPQMQVTVPPNIGPGMPFLVQTPHGVMQVTCPQGVMGGVRIIIGIPAPSEEAQRGAEERAQAALPNQRMEREQTRTSQFRGPCKDCCTPLAPYCVSADGMKIYGRVPTTYKRVYGARDGVPLHYDAAHPRAYVLPLCLHTCLCPQLGGNPCPFEGDFLQETNVYANCCLLCIQEGGEGKHLSNCPDIADECGCACVVPVGISAAYAERQRDSNLQPSELVTPAPLDGLPLADTEMLCARARVCVPSSCICCWEWAEPGHDEAPTISKSEPTASNFN